MDFPEILNLSGFYIIIVASIMWLIIGTAIFYIKHAKQFDKEYPILTKNEFHWLVWPAIAANSFFNRLFGRSGSRIKDLYTWRSIGVTFLISFLANAMCVILILTSIPNDLPPFDLRLIQILGVSHIVFIIFNFFGDLISISFTRHVLYKITTGKCNFVRYLGIDVFGILLGYLVTFMPTLVIVISCLITGDELNKWINSGLLGNVLIPFSLFIFATTNMPVPFPIFAFISVFSVTIPTIIYLFLMAFCYLGYRTYYVIWKNKEISTIEAILRFLFSFTKISLIIAPFLLALAGILKYM